MLRRFLETLKELILLFLLLGFGSALIDYARINAGSKPLFSTKSFDSYNKIESYQGLFYTASRKITSNIEEDFIRSSKINYQLFTLDIPIVHSFKPVDMDYQLIAQESDNCNSKLYYKDSNRKIYLSCIDSIELKDNANNQTEDFLDSLKKDPSLIEDVLSKCNFIKANNNLVVYQSDDSILLPKIRIYECPNKDIYFSLNGEYQDDFCTNKTDFKKKN